MGPIRPLIATIAALALAIFASPALAAPAFPALTGRVVDAANVIPPDAEARLDQKLAALEAQSGRQLVVATLPDLQGYDIADYGYQLGRAWGIGDKERNDGALLIVAPGERKLRIEVGYGLEGVLTDGMSSLIINQTIVPKFKAGDLAGGIEDGVDRIVQLITLPPEEAAKLVAAAEKAPESSVDWGTIIFFGIIFLVFVLPLFRRKGGRRYRSGGFVPVVWPTGGGGFGRGGGFGGGFGGGGFSGGGGSFGGGGSSGSW
jgi:uncharacterized protein